MRKSKQNFNGGSCVTNIFSWWLFVTHQTVQKFTRICAPKIRPGHYCLICMAAFFAKMCSGKLSLLVLHNSEI